MKVKTLIISVIMTATLLTGCAGKAAVTSTTTPATTPAKTAASADVVSSASVTSDPAVFEKAISKDGTWIIAITADMNVDKDLVLEGDFKDKDTPPIVKRKIALYNQDAKHVVTARYTLTAPKLTIKSPMASLQHGIFKGDIYVQTADFKLIDNKVVGNIYFATDADKAGFKMDAKSSVSGVQEVKK